MSMHNSKQSSMEAKLTAAFAPEKLEVINESRLHAGHHRDGGHEDDTYDGAGETHFRIRIVAEAFTGMSRVQRHRAINDRLKEELESGVHALALEPSAPGEAARG
ncbi:BolA family protein [Brucella suis]|uniref:BolA family protein n=1 Tax=Brucella suis TaxID=29461 RepID=UPI0025550C90|nr:BolA family protein [Brucella suis]